GYWEFQLGLGAVWGIALVFIITTPIQIHYLLRRMLTGVISITICLVMGSLLLQSQALSEDTVASTRDFYGLLSVKEKYAQEPENHQYVLTHGITTHGYQFLLPEKRTLPTAYYVEDSGVGIGFLHHPVRPGRLKVGVIGLGVGVLATYGQAGDEFRFYEINPTVADVAQGEYFSYLRDTSARVEIILGDGRLSLERELAASGSQDFDLLVVDAFNSDSIPTHLLTQEAFQLYLQHLDPEGILALHISSQYLNLRPVVWGLADSLALEGRMFYHKPEDIRSKPSLWILLTTSQAFLNDPEVLEQSVEREAGIPGLRIWRDDYSNLFQILK
ncbi:MAG: fused MFS/spermidine synthase, partial [Anaerolineales bacterium]|nr:fused MFS/spermidine synthase [Anaerolineales bacterium]